MRAGGGEQPPLLPQAVRLQRQQLPVLEAPAFSPLRREAAKMGADVRSLKFGSDKDLDQNIKQIFFFFFWESFWEEASYIGSVACQAF